MAAGDTGYMRHVAVFYQLNPKDLNATGGMLIKRHFQKDNMKSATVSGSGRWILTLLRRISTFVDVYAIALI